MELDFSFIELERMVNRWNEKANHCNGGDRLENLFDEFVTRYIVLAAYSNALKKSAKIKNDSFVCTKEVAELLQLKRLFLCQQLKSEAEALCNAITQNRFDVKCSKKLSKSIRKGEDFIETLLRVLYGIRCNLFHGRKQCIAQQEYLLRPAIDCLKIINREAMEELNNRYINQF